MQKKILLYYLKNINNWNILEKEWEDLTIDDWLIYAIDSKFVIFFSSDFTIVFLKKILQINLKDYSKNELSLIFYDSMLEYTNSKLSADGYFLVSYYVIYLYLYYNYMYIYVYSNKFLFNLTKFRIFYDIIFKRLYLSNFIKTKLYYLNILYKFISFFLNKNISLKEIFNVHYPMFSLLVVITIGILIRNRNLFVLLNFYSRLFLFETTGIDNGHIGRKKQSCQLLCFSNILWHVFFREHCSKIIVWFLNFKHNFLIFLTMLTHVKYIKRFKGNYFFICSLWVRLREQFGFMRGRKLAIRKRFVVRSHKLFKKTFENLEYNYKKIKHVI